MCEGLETTFHKKEKENILYIWKTKQVEIKEM